MQDETAESRDYDPADGHGRVPCDDEERRRRHDRLHVESCVEKKYSEGAISEEQGANEGSHAFYLEQRGGEKRIGGDIDFDVRSSEEEQRAHYEEDVDVRRLPALGRVRGVGNGVGEEDKARNYEQGAQPVHLDSQSSALLDIRWNVKI